MRYFLTSATVFAAVSATWALPLNLKRVATAEISDTTILNYALTLEHLESAFYQQGLDLFDESAFEAAGIPTFARGRFVQIGGHEKTHVTTLQSVLGPNATQACDYSFPFTDATSFVALSATFEGIGVAAYTGAANFLSDPGHVTAAASILSTESRQAAWVKSAVQKQNPWSTPFETPLGLNQVFTLASGFITACPESNPALPVRAFLPLNVTSESYYPGGTVTVAFDPSASGSSSSFSLALLSGLDQFFAPLTANEDGTFTATLPNNLMGTVYAVVSNSSTSASDADTVAGVAVLLFPFNSQAQPE